MRVVVAPDSFKGSLTAIEASATIAREWRRVRPGDEVAVAPMADGGEGTIDAFELAHPDAVRHPIEVTGPDDRPVLTSWLELTAAAGGDGPTAVIEFASTSGITLLDELRPLTAHSAGFGQAIAAALTAGCRTLLLGIGGSGSTDGGQGALAALGARFLGVDGRSVGLGNAGLGAIERIDISALVRLPEGVEAIVLSDVRSPLLGDDGAVSVFGPQKGITAGLRSRAEHNLAHFARRLAEVLPTDPLQPGAGAAGGTGFGLSAWGAAIRPGSAVIADALGLARRIGAAELVITGEGRWDAQSLEGKVVGYVLELAASNGVPAALIAGDIQGPTTPFARAASLSGLAGSADAALREPQRWLAAAAAQLATTWR